MAMMPFHYRIIIIKRSSGISGSDHFKRVNGLKG